jgi:hypothetical protein
MRTHHTLVFILGHVTVYPLPIRLAASRIRHVAPLDLPVTPPDLPVASRRVQNTYTTSLNKLYHTSDSRSREEGGSLHPQENPEPISWTRRGQRFWILHLIICRHWDIMLSEQRKTVFRATAVGNATVASVSRSSSLESMDFKAVEPIAKRLGIA